MTRPFFNFRFSKGWGEWIGLFFLLAWAVFLFSRYFSPMELVLLQQAFSIPAGFASSSSVRWQPQLESFSKILGVALWVTFVTLRVGYFSRRWLNFKSDNSLMLTAIDFGLGILILDSLWLALGFNQLWYPSLLRLFLTSLFLICVIEKTIHFSSAVWPPIRLPHWPYGLLALAGLIYWLFSLLHGFLPETQTDGLSYHLGIPHNWLMRHGIGNFTSPYYDGYPYGGELFFLNAYLFQWSQAAKLLNIIVFGVCALAAAGWAQESGGENAGWLAWGLTLTTPLLALVAWTTQIETFLVLFSILFFYGLYRLLQTDSFQTLSPTIVLTGLWG